MAKSRARRQSIYELGVFEEVLREAIHPGGLNLTRHIAERACIGKGSLLLDVACGKGTSDRFLAQEVGCRVVGVDLSENMIQYSREKAGENHDRVMLVQGNGECLPFRDSSFDFVLFECTFSLFQDKSRVSAEAFRILRSRGKLLMSDLYVKEPSKGPVSTVFPCAAGALTICDYLKLFSESGFEELLREDHSKELVKLYFDIIFKFGSLDRFCELISKGKNAIEKQGPLPVLLACPGKDMRNNFGYGFLLLGKP